MRICIDYDGDTMVGLQWFICWLYDVYSLCILTCLMYILLVIECVT